MENWDILNMIGMYIKEILSLAGAVIAFFVGKRSRQQQEKRLDTDITSSELENVEAALKIYRLTLDDLQLRLTEAQRAYTFLEERFHVAVNKNRTYEQTIGELETKLKNCKGL